MKEALKLALEALEMFCEHGAILRPIETRDAIKEALAQPDQLFEENERLHVENRRLIERIETIGVPVGVGGFVTTTTQPEQEPVAYGMWDTMIGCGGRMMMVRLDKGQDGCTVPLYTTPPQGIYYTPPQRKPLTDKQKQKLIGNYFAEDWAQKAAEGLLHDYEIKAAHGIKE